MTITQSDIKLFQAQDNTDNDSGGGSRTSNEIIDGDVNNLFPDISRLDTVAGRVNLRKAFPTVTTDNNDVYYGAHSIIRSVPNDPNVSALLFHTDNPHDTRLGAQDKIENYVVASFVESFYLYGNHVEGSKAVTFLQLLESRPPDTGEVYLLKDGVNEQYVRVSSVETNERTFVHTDGKTYIRRQIICIVEQSLEYSFVGSTFTPYGQSPNSTYTWATQVADASKFYSTKLLSSNVSQGDTSLIVDSIYEQIVPASKTKTFLTNETAMGTSGLMIPNLMPKSVYMSVSTGVGGSLGEPVVPNSITKFYGTGYGDDGQGNLVEKTTGSIRGSIDYITGDFTQTIVSGGANIDYTPVTIINDDVQFSGAIKITQENVGNVFSKRLSPTPAVGACYIDYRSGGKWYRFASTGLRSEGIETIGEDALIGSGTLYDNDDGTATVNITLAAPADLDSVVIISWGSSERLDQYDTYIENETEMSLVIDLGQSNIDPLSFVCQLYSTALAGYKNITSDANGVLIDSVTGSYKVYGELDFIEGVMRITGCDSDGRVPRDYTSDNNNPIIIDFNYAQVGEGVVGESKTVIASRTPTVDQIAFIEEDSSTGVITFQLDDGVAINSLAISMLVYQARYTSPLNLRSNSIGQLIRTGSTEVCGTVDSSGLVSLVLPERTYTTFVGTSYNYLGQVERSYDTVTRRMSLTTFYDEITIKYTTGDPASFNLSHNITGSMLDICEYEITVPTGVIGEVEFKSPSDTSDLYHSQDGLIFSENGAQIGTIDNTTGIIKHSFYNYDFTNLTRMKPSFSKLLVDNCIDHGLLSEFTFRTAATKLTTSSFGMIYETANGSYSATSDTEGNITGDDIDYDNSYVDTLTGMVHLEFTSPVYANSMRYDAVAETSLPLDPELLGLNPIRLPSDGRVPVFKAGYILVIFNEVETPVDGGTPTANQVQVLTRDRQALIEVVDTNNKRLDPTEYVADRETGTLTFNSDVALVDKYGTALVAPFTIIDRVEDMVMASDVQINGLISLSAPLSRDYTSDDTKVASALVFGDTGSRVYNLFTQEYWNSGSPVWSDERIGDDTTAKYDTINYGIEINNENSTAERWSIIFTTSTTVKVVGEKLGVVETSVSIALDDIAPLNPTTGLPYFIMAKEGFGSGWVTNNVIRFNTDSGDNNMWIIRTIQAGALSEATDSIDLEVRGDAN